MNHKVYFDKNIGVARIDLHGMVGEQDVRPLVDGLKTIFHDSKLRYLLNDVSDLGNTQIDKPTRRAMQEMAKNLAIDKIAVVGASPAIRMITKIVIGVLGGSTSSKFFRTEQEAARWLKGG